MYSTSIVCTLLHSTFHTTCTIIHSTCSTVHSTVHSTCTIIHSTCSTVHSTFHSTCTIVHSTPIVCTNKKLVKDVLAEN